MDPEFRELYQEIIMDHNRSPRNHGRLEHADLVLSGNNPLCGDHYTIYIKLDGQTIRDIRFDGAGCAISKASASVMSAMVKGKKVDEAEKLFDLFHKIVTGEMDAHQVDSEWSSIAAFSGVSEFPVRVKCATLPWHTLHNALQGKKNEITTE